MTVAAVLLLLPLLLLPLVLPATAVAAAPASFAFLFSDLVANKSSNVALLVNHPEKDASNPLLREDKPWEAAWENTYPSIHLVNNTYMLFYNGILSCPHPTGTCPHRNPTSRSRPQPRPPAPLRAAPSTTVTGGTMLALSRDGVRFTKPSLGLVDFNGSTANNILLASAADPNRGVFLDSLSSPPAFRAFGSFDSGLGVASSTDGVHWSAPVSLQTQLAVDGDTHNNLLRLANGSYVAFTRYDNRSSADIRREARSLSADLTSGWAPATQIAANNASDQLYALVVFPFHQGYLGLAALYDQDDDGKVFSELYTSPDTLHWARLQPDTAFIPHGPPGSVDSHTIYAAGAPLLRDPLTQRTQVYYAGGNGPHNGPRSDFICRGSLRPDGFAGLWAAAGGPPGRILTVALEITGATLHLTVDATAAAGGVRVGVAGDPRLSIAACQPLTGNLTDIAVAWHGAAPNALGPLVGSRKQFDFLLSPGAVLYTMSFA